MTYAIVSMYCVLVPYVVLFAMPFFFVKYAIDKYNIVVKFRPTFQGTGEVLEVIKPLTIFIILLVQACNYATMSQLIKSSDADSAFLEALADGINGIASIPTDLADEMDEVITNT